MMNKTFGTEFFDGFCDGAPESYNFEEDAATDSPWCAPWANYGVETYEWFDANMSPYNMGKYYAKYIYQSLEDAFGEDPEEI